MREIKFRAWDKENRRMFAVDGLSFRNRYITDEAGQHTFKFNQCYLMQYTGLRVKNGEIYEDDLLLYHNGEVIRVIWMGNPASFSPKEIDILHEPTIIGNIYENPELMEGTDANG